MRATNPLPLAAVLAGVWLGIFLLAAGPAAGIIYVDPGDGVMVDRAPIIVFGEVRSVAAAPGARYPSTDVVFEVEEVLKGSVAGGTIVVRQLGGVSQDGVFTGVIGLPLMAAGDRMLLFLEEIPDVRDAVAHRTVELSLGMFFEVPSATGSLLVREATFHEAVPGRTVERSPVPRAGGPGPATDSAAGSSIGRAVWSGRRTTSRPRRRPMGRSP